MTKFVERSRSFLNSYYYPLAIFLIALICHSLSIEVLGASLIISSVIIGLLTCDDLKFIISPLIMFIMMFSEKSIMSGKFYTTPYIVAMIILAIIIVGLFIAHFIIYRKNIDFKGFTKSKLFLGFLFLSISFLLNGFLNFDEYVLGNFTYALILIGSISLVFWLFYVNLKITDSLKNYVFYILYLTSLLVTIQLFLAFVHQIEFNDGSIVKETIRVGWGMWNNIGGMLAFLLPIHFYFASTVKKFGFIFYLTGGISFLAIILSLSRSSLLSGGITIVICAIVSCFVGVNKKINRILTLGAIMVCILGIVIYWDNIASILNDYLQRGLDDNGRFEIYEYGIINFFENPIFGTGFYSDWAYDFQFIPFLPYRYHNTIIQMMGACGIVGLFAYLWHRFETLELLWQKRSVYTLYMALAIGTLLFGSLLDNHFFNMYPTFIYSLLLVLLEKCSFNTNKTKIDG